MQNYTTLATIYEPYLQQLDCPKWRKIVTDQLAEMNDGNLPAMLAILNDMPPVKPLSHQLDKDSVIIDGALTYNEQQQINAAFRHLMPWRKGPFTVGDIHIDAEWQCHMKWNRIKDKITPLKNRAVLDVGSNNGYFGWRMRGAGARHVLGVDPALVSIIQFFAINHLIQDFNHVIFPLKMEKIPARLANFDSIFSMGVLYHRRAPLDHISELYEALRAGGELIIETLVVEGEDGMAFMPPGRYARMNNVWFLPSVATLQTWLEKIGFCDIKMIDLHQTSPDEQRATAWKPGVSLREYLDPDDINKTIEGHPPPLRVTLTAQKPAELQRLKRYEL
tara:strand:+ start:106161 stop:107162 length:1002 start_codon:yes stop_codon:yes gene_type:complete